MRFFYILFIISLLFGCKTEEKIIPDSKPILIQSLPVGNVLYNEVTLNAEVNYLNDERVVEYGFIINDASMGVEKRINLGSSTKVGLVQYRYKPENPFVLANNYGYSFYIQTEEKLYKTEITFFRVKDFWVDQNQQIPITLGDTLRLTGNFKQLDDTYGVITDVNFNATPLELLYLDDKSMHIKISDNLAKHNSILNLYVHKKNASNLRESLVSVKILGKVDFKVGGPQYLNDGLELAKYGLDWYDDDFLIIVGNNKIPIIDQFVDLTGLRLTGTEQRLGYFNGVDTVISSKKLKLKSPSISDFNFEKISVHPNEFIFVNIKDYIPYFGDWDNHLPTVTFGQHKSPQIYLYSAESFRFKTPNLSDGEYDVALNSPIYGNFKHPIKFKVEKLKFNLENKGPLYINDELVFKGNFRGDVNYAAKIGDMELHIGPAKNGIFKFKLEKALLGKQNINVGFIDQDWYPVFADAGVKVDIPGIRIDDFYPKSGEAGDIITLKGRGLKSPYSNIFIIVGDVEARVMSTSDTETKFFVPMHPRKGKLPIVVGYNHFDGIVYAKDFLEVL